MNKKNIVLIIEALLIIGIIVLYGVFQHLNLCPMGSFGCTADKFMPGLIVSMILYTFISIFLLLLLYTFKSRIVAMILISSILALVGVNLILLIGTTVFFITIINPLYNILIAIYVALIVCIYIFIIKTLINKTK